MYASSCGHTPSFCFDMWSYNPYDDCDIHPARFRQTDHAAEYGGLLRRSKLWAACVAIRGHLLRSHHSATFCHLRPWCFRRAAFVHQLTYAVRTYKGFCKCHRTPLRWAVAHVVSSLPKPTGPAWIIDSGHSPEGRVH